MVKKMLKSKSKRMQAGKRYKIEKKVRQHNKKLRRQSKKDKQGKKKSQKLIIVPGDCPFRNQILAEASTLRQNLETQKVAKKDAIKAARLERREAKKATKEGGTGTSTSEAMDQTQTSSTSTKKSSAATSFQELLKRAEARGYVFEKREITENLIKTGGLPDVTKAFYKEFQHVVKESDVVIQVLDARDPMGTRSEEIEEIVRADNGKRLVMLLNKSDLIPISNLKKWVNYLRSTTGTIVLPFKANTQKQKNNLGSVSKAVDNQGVWNTSKSVGVADILSVLGNWAKSSPGGVTVGVVGMPNVGKSSIINSLKRSKACTVGAKEGVTRSSQKVIIDSKLKLIDSPGVYLSEDKTITANLIMKRVPKATLMLHYTIPDFNSEEEFLCQIALKYKLLRKGGLPNVDNAEQKIINDWHCGHIKYFTEPPESESAEGGSSLVTTGMSEPFDIDAFVSNNTVEDDESDEEVEMDTEEEADEDDEENDDAPKKVRFSVNLTPKLKKKEGKSAPSLLVTKKTIAKKMRKSKKKSTKKADELSTIVENLSF